MFFRRFLPLTATFALLLLPRMAEAADGAVERAAGFVRVVGESGELACMPGSHTRGEFTDRVIEILSEADLDPEVAVVLTGRALSCADLFYVPLANDVRGIGYARSNDDELFDYTPDSRLAGVAFLNDLPYWLSEEDEFRTAFLHEVGHRFLARVHAEVDGQDVDLTGREGGHWSYFFETDSSPLEGNHFVGEGPFRTETERYPSRYSPLDLYLMGALAAEDVGALRLLEGAETSGEHDCRGSPLTPSSAPQYCEPRELSGQWLEFSVDEIVAAEGSRLPAFGEAPRGLDVAFVLFDDGSGAFDSESCDALSQGAERRIEDFSVATRGTLTLGHLTEDGTPCSELEFASAAGSSGCAVSQPQPLGSWTTVLAGAAVAFWRRRGREKDARSGLARG